MNNLKTIFALAFIALVSSCSKSDDDSPTPTQAVAIAPEQDPLNGYLIASGFNQVATSLINAGDYESGYSFIPLVNGKITTLVVKIPDTRSALRVTIWDKATGGALRTETLNITTADTEVIKTITPLDLIKDKEYVISMNSNDYYSRVKSDESNAVYPFVVGDLKITSYLIRTGAQQIIPNEINANRYIGNCSFKFQK